MSHSSHGRKVRGRKEIESRGESSLLSSRIVESPAWPLRTRLAQPVHDTLEHRLDDAQERPLRGVPVPAGLHQLPALLVKHGQTLWSGPWGKAHGNKATVREKARATMRPNQLADRSPRRGSGALASEPSSNTDNKLECTGIGS